MNFDDTGYVILQNIKTHYPELVDEFNEAVEHLSSHHEYYDITDSYEEPCGVNGANLLKRVKDSTDDFRLILALNEKAHLTLSSNQKELAEYGRYENFGWTPLFAGAIGIGENLTIEVISNKERLLDEAITQQHCVFSYLQKAMSGECVLLSVTDDEGRRVSTVELTHCGDLEELEIQQCYGYKNATTDSQITYAVESFVEQLNEDPEELGVEIAHEIEPDIDLDDAESSPSAYASRLSQIPFNTDAAHRAYFILSEMTPDGFSIESYISDNNWGELFYSSKFGNDIRVITDIVAEFRENDVTPEEVIKLNAVMKCGFDDSILRKELIKTHCPKLHFWNQVNQIVEEEDLQPPAPAAIQSVDHNGPRQNASLRPF